MSKEKPTTKTCKHCKSEISYQAKVCPNCRKKLGMGIVPKIIIGIVAIAVIGNLLSGGDTEKEQSSKAPENETVETSTVSGKVAEPVEEKIEYTSYNISELMEDLDSNALKAKEKYDKQYVEITGKLSNIDSSGKYISLTPDEDFAIIGIQCYIKDDDQKGKVMEMTIDDIITLKGKITGVGEVLGYSLDITEIN